MMLGINPYILSTTVLSDIHVKIGCTEEGEPGGEGKVKGDTYIGSGCSKKIAPDEEMGEGGVVCLGDTWPAHITLCLLPCCI